MVHSMAKWMDKVAVVTGASAGIGASIVDALLEKGVIVVGIARRTELIEERAKNLTKKQKLYAVKADLSKEEDILNALKWIEDNVGPFHILINNAGTTSMGGLLDTSTENMKKVLDLNILALSIITRETVKMMKTHKIDGHIIHINSNLGHQVLTHALNIYPASKFAVTALTETLRRELNSLGLKIKITSLSPGLVATELTSLKKDLPPEAKAMYETMDALQPQDIANGVIYVLSTPEHVQIHELTICPW
ncbi:hypothetical protein Zmor_017665 [Zophobas morio]|uniref:Dehydrogenase/reductase SDR family member 11 n=1 Tax=Zophobas morio TaxID=2755281 RepID=A0AA38MCR8_9CUCU|nr:hypothetical protein Zmor_017665 [Zophobas morio]